jgi:outer membrane protein assembly factor BamA
MEAPDMQDHPEGRRFFRLLLLGAVLASLPDRGHGLAAQESEERLPWRTSYFPYLHGLANDGPVLSAKLRYWQPAEYEARTTYTAAFDVAAGLSARGSRYATARFRAPGLWDDWRLDASLVAERLARFGYFGLGNDTEQNKDLVGPDTPFLYRVRRTRFDGRVELTRRIKEPFYVALRTDVQRVRFTTLPGPSVFRSDFGERLEEDDLAGRLAFIYDTRDNEFNTRKGILAEAGVQVGSANDGYNRWYAVLRGYLPIREGTILAGRIAGSELGGRPSLYARFNIPTWNDQTPVLGGEYSHRSFDTGRFAGEGTLFGNFEVRHDVLPLGDLGALSVIAFLDAGRVFEEEPFRLTTEDLHVGGGGGIALRILRSTIFTFNFAGGPDGFNFSVGSGWMF